VQEHNKGTSVDRIRIRREVKQGLHFDDKIVIGFSKTLFRLLRLVIARRAPLPDTRGAAGQAPKTRIDQGTPREGSDGS